MAIAYDVSRLERSLLAHPDQGWDGAASRSRAKEGIVIAHFRHLFGILRVARQASPVGVVRPLGRHTCRAPRLVGQVRDAVPLDLFQARRGWSLSEVHHRVLRRILFSTIGQLIFCRISRSSRIQNCRIMQRSITKRICRVMLRKMGVSTVRVGKSRRICLPT